MLYYHVNCLYVVLSVTMLCFSLCVQGVKGRKKKEDHTQVINVLLFWVAY